MIIVHKTMTITLLYVHISQEHKKKAANLLNGLTAPSNGDCHKTVSFPKSQVSTTSELLYFNGRDDWI